MVDETKDVGEPQVTAEPKPAAPAAKDEPAKPAKSADRLSKDEIDLRRYEAKLGLWKVLFGTLVVGIVSVLIPASIDYLRITLENTRKNTELDIESRRKATELELAEQAAHLEYIKTFSNLAVNQDIELRIRFADYFAHMSGAVEQNALWLQYLKDLKTLKEITRQDINKLEKQLVAFKKLPPDEVDNAEFDRVTRELAWANAEIGYVPSERSTVVQGSGSSQKLRAVFGLKKQLYQETLTVVGSLIHGPVPISDRTSSLDRFWVLYRKDLIGVESRDFSTNMVEFGAKLKKLTTLQLPPDPELRNLASALLEGARAELEHEFTAVGDPTLDPTFMLLRAEDWISGEAEADAPLTPAPQTAP